MSEKETPRQRGLRRLFYALLVVFGVVNIGLTVLQFASGQNDLAARGFMFPLFYLIPLFFTKMGWRHCYRFYIVGYLFCLFAFSYGCVYGVFKYDAVMDKVSHFLSGFVFTLLGLCFYFGLVHNKKNALASPGLVASYGLFFSMFIAVCWEVTEMLDFLITGNDSQNHLTTGVFDTMMDLSACLVASLVCAAAYMLYCKWGAKLLTGWVMEEFIDKNVTGHEQNKN